MGSAIGTHLPHAVAVALSPVPMIAGIFMLFSQVSGHRPSLCPGSGPGWRDCALHHQHPERVRWRCSLCVPDAMNCVKSMIRVWGRS
jgi:hypothetical protein